MASLVTFNKICKIPHKPTGDSSGLQGPLIVSGRGWAATVSTVN